MTVNNISIDTIGLSVRSVNALHRIEVHTVGDMLQYDENRLLEVRNLGRKSVQEILSKIEEYKALESSDQNPAEPKQPMDVHAWTESESGKA
jgi:DNA-directed RNA polymerase subunit alpha